MRSSEGPSLRPDEVVVTTRDPELNMTLDNIRAALGGRYVIEREIGRGGMARVYLAKDVQHDRDVAVKVLDYHVSQEFIAERFLREIHVTAKLIHPNIIPLLDSGRLGNVLYYVTPFAAGESLRDRIKRERQLPLRDVLRITSEMADALDAAHKAGVIHRDVKPENVLLVSGHAVVCDFGIARALSVVGANTLTGVGVSLGTPAYMSPEQAAAEQVDGRSDIYALGCVMYEMLAGDPPFSGSNMQRVMAQHASNPAPSVRLVRPVIPESVDRLLAKALAKAPAERFQTAGKMRDAIDELLETNASGSVAAQPVARRLSLPRLKVPRVPRVPLRWSIAGVAVVVVALAIYLWRRSAVVAPLPDAGSTRIAVLPMANPGGDPQDRSFGDGLTDEMISTLSGISGLRVIARGSVAGYADSNRPVNEIARQLGVGSVVQSTLQKDGNRFRVSVRLLDAATQESRWSDEKLVNADDLFTLQRELSTRVASALRVRLLPAEARRIDRVPTTHPDAYELYARARVLTSDRQDTPAYREALDTATTLLERAVAKDSSFAEAHAALAQVYVDRMFNFEPNSPLKQRAAEEITRALAIDSTIAEAYHARASLAYTRESGWQVDSALVDYKRAIALKPNVADYHASYGALLFHVGLLVPALSELRTTQQLDPMNRFVVPRIARVLWYQGNYDGALALMGADNEFPEEHALVLGYLGRAEAGLRYLDRDTARTEERAVETAAARAVILARLDRRAEADAAIRKAAPTGQPASHFHHAEFMIASTYALLGRPDDAQRWLERMADDGMPNYALITTDPTLQPVRSRPAFQAFLTKERARNDRLRRLMEAP
jgi:serine/threonine-protein kinase